MFDLGVFETEGLIAFYNLGFSLQVRACWKFVPAIPFLAWSSFAAFSS